MSSQRKSFLNTVKIYYSLTKPGVLYGNVITAVAGFLFASAYLKLFDGWLFLALLVGMTLVIASACVVNNFLDRDIDARMERTKKRATVTGEAGRKWTLTYALVLGLTGTGVLFFFTNLLTTLLALFGWIVYVWLYGAWSKRKSWHGTLVGAVSGAVPILAGYTAVIGTIDAGAILLFLALFFWQMPEFYSISIYRRKEYQKAKIPVVSLVQGLQKTKKLILLYTILFVISTLLLTPFGYTGMAYFSVMAGLGLYFVFLGVRGLDSRDIDQWARKMFLFSLVILIVYCVMISVGPLLP